ncbi:E3 ubiquitin-protein ligase NRDP1-like [Malaclemys terrapin pileata]|uniref:E3 ubiquitin-protein ligase NRDP1-like n=1 Tax=Malaclemys terrapin pileata TaxID=2991368 RepID=UPI0023A88676|nr:E3 ubiquitin-protein ligase NRDP1-like [Malaclemys terrapin pileata]
MWSVEQEFLDRKVNLQWPLKCLLTPFPPSSVVPSTPASGLAVGGGYRSGWVLATVMSNGLWSSAFRKEIGRIAEEELMCCSPLNAPHCEHAFCNACITQWFSQQQTCPVDRSVVTVAHLRPVPRIMRNMLSKLQITCDNAVFGCTAVVRLDNLMSHLNDCEHNPKRPVTCEQGCGLEMPKDELPTHNCIKHLRSVVQQQQTRIAELEKTSAEHKHQLAEQKRDIQLLKAYMRAIRSVNPNLQNLEETIEYNEILEWVNSLQPARVTRWGGMISTPDAVLQAVIKRSLMESGCPTSIINELIENAHERNWPQGLATLETRQMNRRYYENYVAKRIPGKQAVVVMACENQHMGEDMVLEPGLRDSPPARRASPRGPSAPPTVPLGPHIPPRAP